MLEPLGGSSAADAGSDALVDLIYALRRDDAIGHISDESPPYYPGEIIVGRVVRDIIKDRIRYRLSAANLRSARSGEIPDAPFVAEYELATLSNFESLLEGSALTDVAEVKLDDIDTIVSLVNRLRASRSRDAEGAETPTCTPECVAAKDDVDLPDVPRCGFYPRLSAAEDRVRELEAQLTPRKAMNEEQRKAIWRRRWYEVPSRYETRDVLDVSYTNRAGVRRTHSVAVASDGLVLYGLCTVKSLASAGQSSVDAKPTCAICKSHDPRFGGRDKSAESRVAASSSADALTEEEKP